MLYVLEFGNGYYFSHKKGIDDLKTNPGNYVIHMHAEYELIYLLRSNAQFAVEEQVYNLAPHSLMLIKPGEHHQLRLDNLENYERVIINFSAAAVPPGIRALLEKREHVYNIEGTYLAQLFARLDDHYRAAEGELRNELMKASLTQILVYLCNCEKKVSAQETLDETLEQVLAFIAAHLTEIRTIEDITGPMGMSKSHLCKLFSANMHVSVMAYVRTKKCMLARSLIQRGEKPTTVYAKCGFNSYSSFFRAYLRLNDESPAEFRRK